ncbi:hypothetical protein AGMMS50212_09260 [Spirochaetia bacterium]|nr:hypothetical protein AGMMS50212_09190 [Spirochaetia bacterium]GHV83586.1 hypothetical protein AGMMS50212_09260 [Spirochaetia bacterium]
MNRVVVIGTLTSANSGSSDVNSAFYLAGTESSTTPYVLYGTPPGGTITISGMNNAALHGEPSKRVLLIGGGHYLNFEDITLTGGSINASGGGILLSEDSNITLLNGTKITENTSDTGGGIHVLAGTLTIDGADISNNIAGNGGGVCIGDNVSGLNPNGTVIFKRGTISGNLTNGNGGGIWIYGDFTMEGGNIYGNSTSANGGGIWIKEYGIMTYNNGSIRTNIANQGKSIYAAVYSTVTGISLDTFAYDDHLDDDLP